MERRIARTFQAEIVVDDGDMKLFRALPTRTMSSLGPFVFIDHYRHSSLRGIGDKPHPHAGIEVISYLLQGSVEHRDSMGNRDVLGAGDAQFIRAGRGMVHAEVPQSGRHGLQLWTSLPPDLKEAEPNYTSFPAAAIPILRREGVELRVITGLVDDTLGPMCLASDTIFAVLFMERGIGATVSVPPDAELGLYVLEGQTQVGDTIGTGSLSVLTAGATLTLDPVGDAGATIALLGGAPVEGPILFSGPFVMDTPDRLENAARAYASGRMGRIAEP